MSYTKDIEITTLTPSNVGGEVTTWAINATLPSGLTFETSNGTIWGTPGYNYERNHLHHLGQQFC
jgi:hypothetical protein